MKQKPLFYGSREFRMILCDKVPDAAPCNTPAEVHDYIRKGIATSPFYRPDRENFLVVFLNTRKKPIGFEVITSGILDSVLIHAREVFCPAIVNGSHSIVLCHNHPGGDPSPSEADIRTNRDLIRAGQILKIEVVDHIILGREVEGQKSFASLRELGHFYV